MKPEMLLDIKCKLGENPLWHPLEKRLYWTDILDGKIYRYDLRSGSLEDFIIGRSVGGFTFQADGALLLFMDHGAVATWRDGKLSFIVDEIPSEQKFRFNDVIADPAGRVFCGTMSDAGVGPGRLYRLDTDGTIQRMYYTDSPAHRIYLYDYDQHTGALSNQRTWLQLPDGVGEPDGMTVDAEDYVWSARWNGSALYRYNPAGIEEQHIEFPARKVTSLTFGGDELSDMYVTTALLDKTREDEGQGAGALFRLNLGIHGRSEFFSCIKI
jgi:sugar lactone lactonase YvrE